MYEVEIYRLVIVACYVPMNGGNIITIIVLGGELQYSKLQHFEWLQFAQALITMVYYY